MTSDFPVHELGSESTHSGVYRARFRSHDELIRGETYIAATAAWLRISSALNITTS
jgi:hypothetical protein